MTIDPAFAVELVCIAFVVALNVWSYLKHRETYAKATAAWEEAILVREHTIELDALLANLCLQAYTNAHLPIWKAWGVMGTISVTAERRLPTDDVD